MRIQSCILGIAASLLWSAIGITQDYVKKKTPCDAPEYFGICDTFVPGTRITGRDKQTILVNSTWPGGPADRGGICAGDQIVSVNDFLSSENTFDRMLHELVSAAPTLVLLMILRGNENLEFSVPRVRESTLAYLSNQKFLRKQLVPLEQTAEGMVVESISYPSPAFEVRLLWGDKLLRVNGSAMESLSRDQLEQVLRPVQATEIVLEVSRAGKQMTFHIFPVTYQEALAKIGRRLSRFGPTSYHCPGGNEFQSRY